MTPSWSTSSSRSSRTAADQRLLLPKKPLDRELAAGTTAHYEDPDYYEKNYARRTDDVEFYVELAQKTRGPVLEYGCGTGRITLPMARAGATVLGVDQSAPMLARLKQRLAEAPAELRERVRVRAGDMRRLKLRERFALVICPFNTFLHLYEREDVEQFLARVREHLAPGGRLVIDVSFPDPDELTRKPERLYRTKPFVYPGVGRVRYGERFDYDGLRQILYVSCEFEPVSGAPPFSMPLTHRQFFPRELEALLHYNGFTIERWVGDFDLEEEVTPQDHHLAVIARLRATRSVRRAKAGS